MNMNTQRNGRAQKNILVVGNWKMNPLSIDEAKKIVTTTKKFLPKLTRTAVVACPPSVFLGSLIKKSDLSASSLVSSGSSSASIGAFVNSSNIGANGSFSFGVQNIYEAESGSFTGEISAKMAVNAGAAYTIVGHSERRKMGETSERIAKKAVKALEAGLLPIICVGEEARNEEGSYWAFIKEQVRASCAGIDRAGAQKMIIAYEPVWAIGAKEAMTPDLICEMVIFIRKVLADIYGSEIAMKVPVLYGGSVNFQNGADIIVKGQVDGLLVGRESVSLTGFVDLLKVVDQAK